VPCATALAVLFRGTLLASSSRPVTERRNLCPTRTTNLAYACNACADACDHCAASCLQEDNVKMMARCIALDIDCAQICRLAASVMARGSEMSPQVCEVCALICEACGEECARHEAAHCQECAEACRRCAQECRAMSGRSARGATRQAVPA
jgi:hypothetical protein